MSIADRIAAAAQAAKTETPIAPSAPGPAPEPTAGVAPSEPPPAPVAEPPRVAAAPKPRATKAATPVAGGFGALATELAEAETAYTVAGDRFLAAKTAMAKALT